MFADGEHGVVRLGVDDREPGVACGKQRIGRDPADGQVVRVDDITLHSGGPPQTPDQGVRLQHAAEFRTKRGHDVALQRRLRNDPVKPSPSQRPRGLCWIGDIDEYRVGPRRGESLLHTVNRLTDGGIRCQAPIDAEHRNRDSFAHQRLAATPARSVAKRSIAERLRDLLDAGDTDLADQWMTAERPACRARGDTRRRRDVSDRDAHPDPSKPSEKHRALSVKNHTKI